MWKIKSGDKSCFYIRDLRSRKDKELPEKATDLLDGCDLYCNAWRIQHLLINAT